MQSVFDYLMRQPESFMNKLFGAHSQKSVHSQSPWACKAIFQSLCPLAKTYVMRLIFSTVPIHLSDMTVWVHNQPSVASAHKVAIDQLFQLRILLAVTSESDSGTVVPEEDVTILSDQRLVHINPYFRDSFTTALCFLREPWSSSTDNDMASATTSKQSTLQPITPPSLAQLDQMFAEKWNKVLTFLVLGCGPGGSHNAPSPPESVTNFLISAGLMQVDPGPDREAGPIACSTTSHAPALRITAQGYEYVLQSVQSQIWVFVYECLKRAPKYEEDVLLFLFLLSFCEAGGGYPVDALTPVQKMLLHEFCQLGIIYRSSASVGTGTGSAERFYVTSLAVNMLFNSSQEALDADSVDSAGEQGAPAAPPTRPSTGPSLQLSVLVQTNFQVTAYLSDPLYVAMLRLFVEVRLQLPNCAIGTITRASMKEAYRLGISAMQIINFLQSHGHDKVKDRQHVIPENVTDQLILWENEKNKIRAEDAVFVGISELASGPKLIEVFEKMRHFASKQKILLWEDASTKAIAVTAKGYPILLKYAQVQKIV